MEKATFRTLLLAFLLVGTSVFSQNSSDFTGQVLYHEGYGMSGVAAYLHTSDGTIIDSVITDVDGYYEFENVIAGTYTITFSTSQPEGGIELSDAFLVMLKLLNLYTFNEIEFLAADVNGSGTITWGDYFMILVGYLNQGNPFPIGPWVFESITTPIPTESRSVYLTGGGSSSGDVNGSLQPDPKSTPVFFENPVVNLTADPSNPIELSVSGGQSLDIAGMHLAIKIPKTLEIVDVETAIPSANVFISGDQIKVTWIDTSRKGFSINEGTSLLVIHAKSTVPTRGSESYSLKLGDESHLINLEGDLIQGANLVSPTINISYEKSLTCSAYPNPFVNSATINYTMQEEGSISIALYDHSGRMVREIENSYKSAGNHQVRFDGQLLLPGIYHYSINLTGNKQAILTGTIIKSK